MVDGGESNLEIQQSVAFLEGEELSSGGGGVVGEIGKFDQSEQFSFEQITFDRQGFSIEFWW